MSLWLGAAAKIIRTASCPARRARSSSATSAAAAAPIAARSGKDRTLGMPGTS